MDGHVPFGIDYAPSMRIEDLRGIDSFGELSAISITERLQGDDDGKKSEIKERLLIPLAEIPALCVPSESSGADQVICL